MTERAPDHVYVLFIRASAERVWQGLLDDDLTKQYWGHFNRSDWQVGSEWKHVRSDGSDTVDIIGEVIEADPPKKLVVTWASPKEADDPIKVSRVTYEIIPLGPDCRLSVTHSDLEKGGEMEAGVTQGWPAVLSNLKTLLETGETLREDEWVVPGQ